MSKLVPETKHHMEREISQLQFDARCAYLDGRVKRAKELNRRADALLRQVAKLAA